ncbi:2OG-Fe dioxygenase family protein [Yersinia massiliensis]|uniref:2OG-Fe dioxygenase family protein n=1 Tax=Yersinia massiliensis TaxID=419257 RepID=A0ABM6UXF4_9GAMM|nr:2OG-Fe dioxygenase family protein [Yersinia massiliensis]AVX39613.1 hypothetical protein DA391_19315 [Yersinia massiliensis]QKJ10376.1 2OG-Fe dioxygenase family protein [Yersinia massiliensis]
MNLKYKIIGFNIKEFGINIHEMKKELPFDKLSWDDNDIKIAQLELLISQNPNDNDLILQEAQHYLDQDITPEKIKNLISMLPAHAKHTFHAFKPFRKRSVSQFIAENINNQWVIRNIEIPRSIGFTQQADHPLDLRQLARRFPSMDRAISDSPILKNLIRHFVEILCECEPQRNLTKIGVTCHQMSLLIDNTSHSVSNSPEGLHQDGSDYIVSALVVDKHNIEGGTSQLYCTEKEDFIKSHTLEPGEGLFHVDRNSTIWHKVTPIKLKDPLIGTGYRNILGFDFNYIS